MPLSKLPKSSKVPSLIKTSIKFTEKRNDSFFEKHNHPGFKCNWLLFKKTFCTDALEKDRLEMLKLISAKFDKELFQELYKQVFYCNFATFDCNWTIKCFCSSAYSPGKKVAKIIEKLRASLSSAIVREHSQLFQSKALEKLTNAKITQQVSSLQ